MVEAGKSKVNVPADLISGEGLPCFHNDTLWVSWSSWELCRRHTVEETEDGTYSFNLLSKYE